MDELTALENNPRITRRKSGAIDTGGRCVVYWMQRSQRATDNAALNCAIEVANQLRKPVAVYFGLKGGVERANLRHYRFMIDGFDKLSADLRRRALGWSLCIADSDPVVKFCNEVKACLLVSDEDPRRAGEAGRARVAREIRVPFWTVDADVIVPSRLLAKEHYAARTIRPKIREQLDKFIASQNEPKVRIPWPRSWDLKSWPINSTLLDRVTLDRSVSPVSLLRGGEHAARNRLKEFITHRLAGYRTKRNRPECDGTSKLSPYLHFGQIGPQEIVGAVRDARVAPADRDAFLEELIVRRELAVNFVRFNSHYDRLDCCEPWASTTLREHEGDHRPYIYDETQLVRAETHDPLWNAAQKQMMLTGWMHGYLRMYWAKKILEWSVTPAEAFRIAVSLNDRYELDGRDPSGYAGIAWAIAGKHDRAWGPERPVYGKVRYMSYLSTSRKFASRQYIDQVAALERQG